MRERLVPGPYLSPSAHRARKRAWVRGYIKPCELSDAQCLIKLDDPFPVHLPILSQRRNPLLK